MKIPQLRCPAAVLALVCAVVLGGCASENKVTYGDARADDLSFAGGVNRPPTPQTLSSMARLLGAEGQDLQAQYVLQRAVQEYPRYLPAYSELAQCQLRLGEVDAAVETLDRGLAMAPEDPVLYNDRGMCHLIMDQRQAALADFDQAVALAPTNARFQANRALTLGLLGDYDRSLDAYRRLLPPGEAHYNVAIISEARQDMARADQEMQQARALGFERPVKTTQQ